MAIKDTPMTAKAPFSFQQGDAIVFCDEVLIVDEAAPGSASGSVRYVNGDFCQSGFRWSFESEQCRLATEQELEPFLAKGYPLATRALGLLKQRQPSAHA